MKQKNNFLGKLKRYRVLLLMLLPAVLYVILFNYIPMAGIVLAFKKYNYVDGIFGSPWNGVDNFRFFFKSGQAWKVTRNTFLYNAAFIEYYGTAEPPVRCGESHLSGLTEPLHFVY